MTILGRRGMGEVYVAEDSKLKRRVALKVLPEEVARDPARLDRFQREAESIAALNHPNIVTIYSIEEADGIRFLTMKLVEGETLIQLVPSNGLDVESLLPFSEVHSLSHPVHGISVKIKQFELDIHDWKDTQPFQSTRPFGERWNGRGLCCRRQQTEAESCAQSLTGRSGA